jgi:hypothetical protein
LGRFSAAPENKFQKPVSFFSSQNTPSKAPHSPHIAPQIHHQKHDVFGIILQKSPEKPGFPHPNFSPQIR